MVHYLGQGCLVLPACWAIYHSSKRLPALLLLPVPCLLPFCGTLLVLAPTYNTVCRHASMPAWHCVQLDFTATPHLFMPVHSPTPTAFHDTLPLGATTCLPCRLCHSCTSPPRLCVFFFCPPACLLRLLYWTPLLLYLPKTCSCTAQVIL